MKVQNSGFNNTSMQYFSIHNVKLCKQVKFHKMYKIV